MNEFHRLPTAAGLARSSQNSRTHGLSSLTSVFVLLPGEDHKEWIQLVNDLTSEFQPNELDDAVSMEIAQRQRPQN